MRQALVVATLDDPRPPAVGGRFADYPRRCGVVPEPRQQVAVGAGNRGYLAACGMPRNVVYQEIAPLTLWKASGLRCEP